jgi:hypothetical protein
VERETGIEPATNGLGSRYSTIELLPLVVSLYSSKLRFRGAKALTGRNPQPATLRRRILLNSVFPTTIAIGSVALMSPRSSHPVGHSSGEERIRSRSSAVTIR